jgi:hypothetical protein
MNPLAGQILALVVLACLAFLLLRRARRRSKERYEAAAPAPLTVSKIVGETESESAAPANGNGSPPEEAELREIYERVGKPESFPEAKEKVVSLAAELVEQDDLEMDEALRTAYRRSLREHRQYLAAKGLA